MATDKEIAAATARAFEQYMLRPPEWKPHPHQVPPPGDWYGWLLLAGRGAGKTDACSNYVERHVNGPPCLGGAVPHWISIVAPTLGDAVTACFSGPSGIRAHSSTAKMVQSAGGTIVRWPNGSQAKMFGAQSPEDVERLRAGGNSCVKINTLVRTARGEVPIQNVTVNDEVWTRSGLRRVLRSAQTGVKRVWRLRTHSGRTLYATPDHMIWTENSGWTQLQFLKPDDIVVTWSTTKSLTESSSTDVETGTTTDVLGSCTDTSSRSTTDLFQAHVNYTSTTSITTSQTTTSPISNSSVSASTCVSTQGGTFTSPIEPQAPQLGSSVKLRQRYANSAVARSKHERLRARIDDFAQVTVADVTTSRSVRLPMGGHTSNGCALCAARSLIRPVSKAMIAAHARVSAQHRSRRELESIDTDNDVLSKIALARSAVTSSTSTAIDPPPLVVDRVESVSPTDDVVPVFDIQVEHDHEFFAGDVIIHNCLAWMEELAAWRYLQQCYEQIRFGLRSGTRPHWIASTTPKPRSLIKKLAKETPHNVVITRATTDDNPFLEHHVREALYEEYGGMQIGRQELHAEILDEDKNALWRRANLDKYRIAPSALPQLRKITVGVDPSGGAGEQGIVVVGKSVLDVIVDGKLKTRSEGYVLDDRTVQESPDGWGRAAVRAAVDWEADDIVVETNFGGDMAVATIAGAAEKLGVNIPIRQTRASRGKRVRAEPVAALSERGYWHHAGTFEILEDQLVTWTEELGFSPDRLDAMVWPAWHNRLVSARLRGEAQFGGQAAQLRIV